MGVIYGSGAGLQSAWRLIYPAQCLTCDALTDADFALCPDCWRETPFLFGVICDACGIGLPGDAATEEVIHCDDCRARPRPWRKGRAALRYEGNARKIAMALKHGDRHDLARPAAKWMHAVAGDVLAGNVVLVPVPLHWMRMARRRFNQSALIAGALGKIAEKPVVLDALVRVKRTRSLGEFGREERFDLMAGTVEAHPKRIGHIKGKRVVLIDDVMTTGATLGACATALKTAGAKRIDVLTLARAGRGT